jgi:hypothetical protein
MFISFCKNFGIAGCFAIILAPLTPRDIASFHSWIEYTFSLGCVLFWLENRGKE